MSIASCTRTRCTLPLHLHTYPHKKVSPKVQFSWAVSKLALCITKENCKETVQMVKPFPLHFKTEFEQFLLWKSTALSHVWQFPLHPSRFANSFCKIWQMSFANFLPSMKLCSSSMSKTIDFLNWIIEQKRKGIGKKIVPHYRTERLLFISLENCIEDFGVGQYYAKPEMRHKTLEV